MGAKPRQSPEPTLSEKFDAFMEEAKGFDTSNGKLMAAAQIAVQCGIEVPANELTYEQWVRILKTVLACRQICDALLPELRNKVRISETLSWIEDE